MDLIGINMTEVKRKNRAAILKYMNKTGPVSRKDIAQVTGLTPASVTQLTQELLEEGMIYETGERGKSDGAGRKKILLDLNWEYAYVLGVVIEPETTVIVLSTANGVKKEMRRIRTDKSVAPKKFLETVGDVCLKLMDAHPEVVEKIDAVSVSITGVVDKEKGTSVKAYDIWEEEVPVCDILYKIIRIPVIIENNVDAYAMAEILFGHGRMYDNLLMVKWGPGIGSTIVTGGYIYESKVRKTCEIGHMIIEKDGLPCSCGKRGCLSTRVSYPALSQLSDFEMDKFGETYLASDGANRAVFDKAIDIFARTIVNCTAMLAPNKIVLLGSLVKDDVIRDRLTEACMGYDPNFTKDTILLTRLSKMEAYIGPLASYIYKKVS